MKVILKKSNQKKSNRILNLPCQLVLSALILLGCSGCQYSIPRAPISPIPTSPIFLPAAQTLPQEPLPLDHWTRTQRADSLLVMLRKRVWGRLASLPDIRRIVTDVAPIVYEAARQPAVIPLLARIAVDNHQTLEATREKFVALQEADLLLEAGGDPNDISSAGAAGVAQWMDSTARGQGLKVDSAASRHLTAQIDTLNWRIAWLTYLSRPDTDPNAPGKPNFTPAELANLDALKQQRETLLADRRAVDERFDPRAALFAHTRYLLGLHSTFPSMDWIFQAYHGGEGGAKKELRLYLGGTLPHASQSIPETVANAIRTGNDGHKLTFEDVYFGVTPSSHSQAFAYLYGRGDDHRHYWWKLRSSREAIAAYRRDPVAFAKQWETFLPGRRTEAVWYPRASEHAISDLEALQAAKGHGLVSVTSTQVPANPPPFVVRPAPLDTANAPSYAVLQPAAKGALLLVAAACRKAGSKTPLTIGDLTVTPEYSARARALHPPKPSLRPPFPPDPALKTLPGGGPSSDFDYHTTGLVFDIARPAGKADQHILDYALSYLEERQIIAVTEAKDNDERRYHLVPNPRYAEALTKIAQTGQLPDLRDL